MPFDEERYIEHQGIIYGINTDICNNLKMYRIDQYGRSQYIGKVKPEELPEAVYDRILKERPFANWIKKIKENMVQQ